MVKLKYTVIMLLLVSAMVYSAKVDTTSRAWSPVVGWIEPLLGDSGMKVFDSHLEGYVYNNNIGLIRMGTSVGGLETTYENTTAKNYGVNNDSTGGLSGYAWSSTAGWIDFAPNYGGVSINPKTGVFTGFALSKNIGWIGFSGKADDGTEYHFVTDWRGKNGDAITDEGSIKTANGMKLGIHVLNNPVSINSGRVEFDVAVMGPSAIKVVILSPVGSLLEEMKFESSNTSSHRFFWDLKNRSGVLVGPGCYLAVAYVKSTESGILKVYKSIIGIKQ